MTPEATTPELADLLPPMPCMVGAIAYFKRFRMEADLEDVAESSFPPGFTVVPWSSLLLDAHADALHASFMGEVDSVVFASLGTTEGCRALMSSIVQRRNFLPQATLLLVDADGPCGTVQGLRERGGTGAVQNLGIAPSLRGRGLGTLLLRSAMHGFRLAGLKRVSLEVTARNERAEKLYRRLGFRRVKTIYKPVPVDGAVTERDPSAAFDFLDRR